jgi:eukaryotic-like serine/threonine-protein kinase
MTNRAHHPADHDAAEFASAERPSRGTSESGPIAVEEVVSREYSLPTASGSRSPGADDASRAGSGDDDEDDAEEVVLEPDTIDRERVEVPGAEAMAALEPEEPAERDASAELRVAGEAAKGEESRATSAAHLAEGAGAAEAAAPRRSSVPPPLPVVTPEELEASREAFTGSSPAEVTLAELERANLGLADLGKAVLQKNERETAARESAPASSPGRSRSKVDDPPASGAKRPAAPSAQSLSGPPFVDEVPDPVTPYEKRVSETVKVADLPPVEQLRGRVLANRYLAEEVVEHTALSISYRADHLALDRTVTVRVLLRGLACPDEACQEVRRVAAAATALEHPHVAATLDFGILSDGWPFVVTEHFKGGTLAKILSSEGKFVLRRVLHVGKQIAQGLSAAHEKDLVHGLLSPDNVLVVEPGSSAEVVKILGFGISKARGAVPGPPRSGVFGVPFYVSPEQAACRPIDARSDIYSLGVILYELMTGAPPFSDGDFAGVLCQQLDDDAPPPSSRLTTPGALAKALDAIIERCLRKEPERRYQTASELADDLIRLESAAARSKRRPMPEVQKPTTTIHSPHPKAEAPEVPGAKVIVHEDVDEPVSPEAPEIAARRSSPSLSVPGASSGSSAKAPASAPGGQRSSQPPVTPVPPSRHPRPPRVRVDQATIRISAVDRERVLNERTSHRSSSWLGSVLAAIRRLISAEGGSRDDSR